MYITFRSVGHKELEDEDTLYIRDIVAARFYEANESARIFTRASSRPLSERRRINRLESPTFSCHRAARSSKNYQPSYQLKLNRLPNKQIRRRVPEEKNKRSMKNTGLDEWEKIIKSVTTNSLRVQEGPRVDIRNQLTATNVEAIDILPRPRSSLPVQMNMKTFKFRHESCLDKDTLDVSQLESEEFHSIIPSSVINTVVNVKDSSEDRPGKNSETVLVPRQGSGSSRSPHLSVNKSGQSIRAESLEGHANLEGETDHAMDENKENCRESLQNILKPDNKKKTISKNDKVDIFDRRIDQLGDGNFPNDVISSKQIDKEQEESESFTILDQDWDPRDICLSPPNFGNLEKSLLKLDTSIGKLTSGTRNLDQLIAQYCVTNTKQVAISHDIWSINKHPLPNKDISSTIEAFNSKCSVTSWPQVSPGENSEISHSRFSTPRNNETKGNLKQKMDCKEFSRFIAVGIQCPETELELDLKLTELEGSRIDFSGMEKPNEKCAILCENNLNKDILSTNEASNSKWSVSSWPQVSRGKNSEIFHPRSSTLFSNEIKGRTMLKAEHNEFSRFITVGIQCSEIELEGTRKKLNDAEKSNEKYAIRSGKNLELEKKNIVLVDNFAMDKLIQEGKEDKNSKLEELGEGGAVGELSKFNDSVVEENSVHEFTTKNVSRKSANSITKTETLEVANNYKNHNEHNEIGTIDSQKSSPEGLVKENVIKTAEERKSENEAVSPQMDDDPSLRDRTSFDISTVYSQDFEKPISSTVKSELEKDTLKTSTELKSISNRMETEKEERQDKNDDITSRKLSVSVHLGNSLEKLVSADKTSDRNESCGENRQVESETEDDLSQKNNNEGTITKTQLSGESQLLSENLNPPCFSVSMKMPER